MSKTANWKDTFRSAMYASEALRARKIHRDLLGYLVHTANQRIRFCWPSQYELARVCSCSERNIHDLIGLLQDIGAVFSVRFSALPKSNQSLIKSLTPNKVTRNANAYYLCIDWAEDVLAGKEDFEPIVDAPRENNISPEARSRGSFKANAKRQRYAPISEIEIEVNADHDEWQFLNAMPSETGSPTSALNRAETGSGATDRTTEYNPEGNSAPNNGLGASFGTQLSKAENSETWQSSLSARQSQTPRSGYGGGEAIASDPRPEALARPEGTQYVAAGARAIDRRAS